MGMKRDLTQGSITKNMIIFSIPMIFGNLLQQLYNVADTFIVGRFLGSNALAAVGSAYTLMVFLTSIILGLCMGSGSVFAIYYGQGNEKKLKNSIYVSFVLIAIITIIINILVFLFIDEIMYLLRVPEVIYDLMKVYLSVIFIGIGFTFIYNYLSSLLRSLGDSLSPLFFLGLAVVINIVLDVWFISSLGYGVAGAAAATVIAQAFSAVGLLFYAILKVDIIKLKRQDIYFKRDGIQEILQFSILTCMQQSVMNFGILMIQGLVNSFGTVVMAAFAVAVKIDSFAYMPVQDFGNAFSVFIAQNYGAGKTERINQGVKKALYITIGFSLLTSLLVFTFAEPLMLIFINPAETDILRTGVGYLRTEGAFYLGIGILFLLYGYYRAVKMPAVSLLLTMISLGTRVVLAYLLAPIPAIGVNGIWWAIPIGWFLADAVGIFIYFRIKKNKEEVGK